MAIKLSEIDPGDIIEKDIFELMGLENSSEEDKKIVMADMMETIENRVTGRLFDALSEEDRVVFEGLVEAGDDEKIKQFLKEKDIDVVKITAEEALFYKTEILGLTGTQPK
jgi:hypothetical protein